MKEENTRFRLFANTNFSGLRRLVQAGFFFFVLFDGWRFYRFYLWASGNAEKYVPRPPSVEGFLPISALMSLKKLVLTGQYDQIHPAGLTIFIAALAIGLFLRKGFCGWICPVGFTSNLAEWTARKLNILIRLPAWLDYPLLSVKYLLLVFFLYIIIWKMPLYAIEQFSRTTYNMVADAKMLMFFLDPSILSLWVMGVLVVVSFFTRNFWCRYLCPYGGLLGILAMASPFQVKRQAANCIECDRCNKVCPGSIRVSGKEKVLSPECIGCMECVAVCPAEDCLSLSISTKRKISVFILPVLVLGVFFLFYLVAQSTGNWNNDMPLDVARRLYSIEISGLAHP
ncbi:MAG: 4Fe-4S binding protein [Proteobacteria bacterium]|nr:4Fe-4S binding protein [Pseudomonadota bacterium]MBU1708611.1 4Fe-4S binding protein [Pseudomonadota bacterium]